MIARPRAPGLVDDLGVPARTSCPVLAPCRSIATDDSKFGLTFTERLEL